MLRRAPGKTARFVVMYAEGTVEDPYSGGHIPDFYDTCLPFADGVGRFDLSMPGQLALLHVFLRGGSVEEPAPGNSVVACPADAQAPPTPPATVARTRGRGEPRLDEDGEPLTTCTGNLTDDTVKDYLDRCRRIPLLSAEAEVDLARRMEAGLYARRLLDDGDRRFPEAELLAVAALGDEARETMICSNLRLVVSLAKRYAGHGMEFLDLIQEGNLGLMHAVAKFDWGQGAKFSTYGTHWVKQAISRAMADLGSTIRKPVHVHDQLLKVRRYLGHNHLTWEGALRRFPDGIAELDVPRESLVRLAKLSQPLLSTDQLSAELDDSVVYAPLLAEADDQVEAMLERLSTRWLHDAIIGRLAHEDPRGAFVLRSRHGGVTGEDETLETIGRRLGVTRERVRQIEKASLERARQIAEEVTATQPTPTPKSASPTTALPRAHAPRRPTPTPITAPVPRRADLTRPAPSAGAAPRRALT